MTQTRRRSAVLRRDAISSRIEMKAPAPKSTVREQHALEMKSEERNTAKDLVKSGMLSLKERVLSKYRA